MNKECLTLSGMGIKHLLPGKGIVDAGKDMSSKICDSCPIEKECVLEKGTSKADAERLSIYLAGIKAGQNNKLLIVFNNGVAIGNELKGGMK